MDQTITGTIKGNTIVLDAPLSFSDGQVVEVVVRDRSPRPPSEVADLHQQRRPDWWTDEDDQILNEIYQMRKRSYGSSNV